MQVALETPDRGLGLLRARILLSEAVVVLGDGDVAGGVLGADLLLHVGAGLDAHELAEALHLVEDHLLHLADVVHDLEVEVEGLGAHRLIRRVVPDVQVSVLQRRLNGDPLRWVERKHLVKQIQRVRVGAAEERLERHLLHVREVPDVFLSSRGANSRKSLLVRRAQVVQNLIKLVDVVSSLEEWLASKQFRENTAYGPDIDYARSVSFLNATSSP